MEVVSSPGAAYQVLDKAYTSPFSKRTSVTPTKASIAADEWKQCYELTDLIAAMYPSTTRIPLPFALPRESYDDMTESQRKAVCWMWYNLFDSCRGGVLADSTANNLVQVTQFLHGLCLPRLVFKCLLIVPTQCVDMWVSALLQLAPRVRVVEFTGVQRERRLAQVLQLGGIVVTTYGIAVNDLVPKDANESEDNVWDVIVFDSAERLKDSTSKTNAALSLIQGNVNLLLTSHPLISNLKDLYTLFDFACEADLFGASYASFKDRFESVVTRSLGKRADDMDRQLAAIAKTQVAEMIDSQYWQNWDEIVTPGGSRRPDIVPDFIATPTPFKNRYLHGSSSAYQHDPTSTPSFSRTKSKTKSKTDSGMTPRPSKTPGRATTTKKRNAKNKPIIPETIDLDDAVPINFDDLENRLANLDLGASSSPSSKMLPSMTSSAEQLRTPTNLGQGQSQANPIIVDDTTPSAHVPTRRTPIRNAFFATHTAPKPTTDAQSQVQENAVPSSPFSPEIVRERQRLSFGRISLLDENNTTFNTAGDEEETEFKAEAKGEGRNLATPSRGSSESRIAPGSSTKSHLEKSLTAYNWTSTESFLRRREVFALELFVELNRVIFGAQLPRLSLVWRKMKNCAGVYHYKDSSITLSKTLLTNSQRLCSTLAHEMAHAATHLLDECPNDRHGPVWQKWARIGRARYPNIISGSVYHNYCSQNPSPGEE